jgi:hypothetical protein
VTNVKRAFDESSRSKPRVCRVHPAVASLLRALPALLLFSVLLNLSGTAPRAETPPEKLDLLLEGREICYDEWGLIVLNPSPVCVDTASVHKLDNGRDTAKLEGWYWLGVWLRSHTPGLKPWDRERRLTFDEVLRLLEPNRDGVFHRHPRQVPWSDPWDEDAGMSRDQLIPLIAAMGVWGKHAELRRLWNALPEDLLGKHAFNGSWLNVLGQPGSNCTELRSTACRAGSECSDQERTQNCSLEQGDCAAAEAKYHACQATNIFSGDLIGPDVVNLYWRATDVNPMAVFPGNTPVQGGMTGEQQLMIKAYTRIAEASVARVDTEADRDTVEPDLNLIVQLLMAKLKFATPISEAAAFQYAHLRPLSYGSWLGAYYQLYGESGHEGMVERIKAGIKAGWRPDVSVLNGVIRWYHRPALGGNPQLATLYGPIIDRYLGGTPDPVVTAMPSNATPQADDLTPQADDLALMESRAADFASFYWIHVANENAEAIKYLSETYADKVEYYGKRLARGTIIAEKRRFIERWPDRNYRPRWNDTKITCEPISRQCTIEGIADFDAKNVARKRHESGRFRYSMRIEFIEDQVRIVAESSEVIERAK